MSDRLGYNKLCNVEDFRSPALLSSIRSVYGTKTLEDPDFPKGHEHRKLWEVAMAAKTLSDLGALDEDAEILGVGAGDEPTIFWLTTKARRVFATDLYLEPGIWADTAAPSMLTDPGRHSEGPWNPRRLVVQHMNALDLRYEDESFAGVFSSSSIEHFGQLEDVYRAAQEMCRVLRPGGIATLSTEFRLNGPGAGLPGTLLFDAVQLHDAIIAAGDWSLVGPLDLFSSPASRASPVIWSEAIAGIDRFPHVVLCEGEHLWTSVHLALRRGA
ncbi:MAG: class I SAM-dependent methyltransferase [Actinomycetota bacterium]|nr:class I SAM-dependent methyltransferase [Actinomycetota bacterium]